MNYFAKRNKIVCSFLYIAVLFALAHPYPKIVHAEDLVVNDSYALESGDLWYDNEVVGQNENGAFNHTGGTNVTNSLTVGFFSDGAYYLSGNYSQLIVNGVESIGHNGTGVFIQSGGTNIANGLNVGDIMWWRPSGDDPGAPDIIQGDGSYTLNSGALIVAASNEWNGWENIGSGGAGTFTQNGGANIADGLNVGSTNVIYDEDGSFIGSSTGNGTYNLDGGTLTVTNSNGWGENIGSGAVGTFTQNGGVNTTDNLNVGSSMWWSPSGDDSGAPDIIQGDGSYTLNSGTLIVAASDGWYGWENIGNGGTGTFTQNGGTNTASGLNIGGNMWWSPSGDDSGAPDIIQGDGSYTLNSGALIVAGSNEWDGWEHIGNGGAGTFTQNGGTNTASGLNVGSTNVIYDEDGSFIGSSTGNGDYYLEGGTLIVAGSNGLGGCENIGSGGTGTFTQTGGTNTANGLNVGDIMWWSSSSDDSDTPTIIQGNGSYTLTDGTLTVASSNGWYGWENIGNGATGTFTQEGGTNNANGLTVGGVAMLYDENGSFIGSSAGIGTYNLDGGTLTVTASNDWDGWEHIGNGGTGTFTQNGGTNTASGLNIGGSMWWSSSVDGSDAPTIIQGNGSYTLNDGTLTVAGSNGWGGWEHIGSGGTGTFTQNGGVNTADNLSVGSTNMIYDENGSFIGSSAGIGTYNLDGGTLTVASSNDWDGWEHIGNGGTGTLNQTGGTNTTKGLVVGSGYFTSNPDGTSSYVTGKGTYNLSGTGNLHVTESEIIGSGGTGELNQSGGSHTVDGSLGIFAGPGISGGTYNLSGGALSVAGGITNNGAFNYSGGTLDADIINNAGGTVTLSGSGTRTVNGSVTNEGTFKVTDTTAEYTGTFTNNGRYESDPSTNIFNDDLIVGSAGYIVGGSGDEFVMNADFINNSTRAADWDTSLSTLLFDDGVTGATNHTFALAGADLGNSGYDDNFAWGALVIGGDDTLTLTDGTDTVGAALYVTTILGLDLGVHGITNLFAGEGITIYYLASALENKYLNGQTYTLAGGGSLMAAVPIPGSAMLLISGLMTLLGIKRYRGR
jgi:hypothetical protein